MSGRVRDDAGDQPRSSSSTPGPGFDPSAGLDGPDGKPEHWGFPSLGKPWHPTQDYVPGHPPPLDVIDNRPYGQWRSRYPKALHPLIRNEAAYLVACAVLFVLLAATARVAPFTRLANGEGIEALVIRHLHKPALAFSGGGLGGTLFGFKWLYHAVAKGMWHLDRRLWRLFTPWISAVLASGFVALVAADVFRLLNSDVVQTPAGLFGVSFLVGYFSDITIGKLNEIAQVLLGQQVDRRQAPQPERQAETPRARAGGAPPAGAPVDVRPSPSGSLPAATASGPSSSSSPS